MSAIIRSVGYFGFSSASAGTGSGFLFYSGSVLPNSGDNYQGVGLELIATSESYLRFRTIPSELDIRADAFYVGNPNLQYISGSGGLIEISSSQFYLDNQGNVYIAGTITASAGQIGGFNIGTSSLYSAQIFISGSPSDAGGYAETTNMFLSMSNFNIKSNGDITGSSFLLTGGTITGDVIIEASLSADSIRTPAGGPYKAIIDEYGRAQFTSASIAGFTINEDAFFTNNFLISGSAVDNEYFISASNFNVKANGDVTGSSFLLSGGRITGDVIIEASLSADSIFTPAGGPFKASIDSEGRAEFTSASIAGFTINEDAFFSDNFLISGAAVGNEYFISASNFNVKANGDLTGSSVLLDGGLIGGWQIGSDFISSSNLIFDSNGTLKTANYESDVSGWILTADGNGFLEVENARIRGTLKTTVFEKETVNAVGGQLWIANSTTITGSVSVSQATMSVANVTGFIAGEILLIKKVDSTGFTTEYVLVDSASRDFPESEDNYQGKLYVQRAYSSGSISGPPFNFSASNSQSYTEGQVVVSTGKPPDTGWIRLNANPNDGNTPYIDIVERTGSGVYDYQLKARIGDLGGIAGTSRVFGNSNPGFGLASENVFLTGAITANTGSIGGWQIVAGAITSSNVHLSSSGGGALKLGSSIPSAWNNGNGIVLSGSGQVLIGNSSGYRLQYNGSDFIVSASDFFVGNTAQQFISASGGLIEISSSNFHLDSNGDVVIRGALEVINPTPPSENLLGYWTFDFINRSNYFSNFGTIPYDAVKTSGTPEGEVTGSGSYSGGGWTRLSGGGVGLVDDDEINAEQQQTWIVRFKLNGNTTIGDASRIITRDASDYFSLSTDGTTSPPWTTVSTTIDIDAPTVGDATPVTLYADVWTIFVFSLDYEGDWNTYCWNEDLGLYYTDTGDLSAATPHSSSHSNNARAVKIAELCQDASRTAVSTLNRLSGCLFDEVKYYNIAFSRSQVLEYIRNPNAIATSTKIVGDQIQTGIIQSNNISTTQGTEIDLDNETIKIGGSGVAFEVGSGIYMDGGTDSAPRFYVGSSSYISFDGNTGEVVVSASSFFVGNSSTQYISGSGNKIEISSSNFLLDSTQLIANADSFFVGNSSTQYISGSGNKIAISSSGFYLSPDGNAIFSGSLTAGSGLIGGWAINSTSLTAGTVTLSSSGVIEVGSLTSTLDTASANKGVYMDNSGNFLAKAGAANTGYIQSRGGDINLRSANFHLSASTIYIDSANNGRINLGATAGAMTWTSGNGVILSGSGQFRAGNPSGYKIQFDGTNATISASSFFVGDRTKQYISGSGTLIEISSSKMHLRNNGTITASAFQFNGGTIGSGSTFLTVTSSGIGAFTESIQRAFFGIGAGSGFDSDGWRIPTTGSNILTNGGFESGVLTPWAVTQSRFTVDSVPLPSTVYDVDNNQIVIQSSTKNSGTYALKFLPTGSDGEGNVTLMAYATVTQSFSITEDTTYGMSYYVSASGGASVTVKLYMGTGGSNWNLITSRYHNQDNGFNKYNFAAFSSNYNSSKIEMDFRGDEASVYVDDFNFYQTNYFSDFTQQGVYIYASDNSYIKMGRNKFELKAASAELNNLTASGDLSVAGNATIFGDLIIQGNTVSEGSSVITAPIQLINSGSGLTTYVGIELHDSSSNINPVMFLSNGKLNFGNRATGDAAQQAGTFNFNLTVETGSGGGVGIGTTTLDRTPLHVYGSGDSYIKIEGAATRTDSNTPSARLELWRDNTGGTAQASDVTGIIMAQGEDNAGTIGLHNQVIFYLPRVVAGDVVSAIDFYTVHSSSISDNTVAMSIVGDNVGIGTTNPSNELHVYGTDDVYGRINSAAADSLAGLVIVNDARTWVLRVEGANSDNFEIRDSTANAQRLVINSSGYVGIGTTTPLTPLHVQFSSTATADPDGEAAFYVYNTGTGDAHITVRTGASGQDPMVNFDKAGQAGWAIGMDQSDSNAFKINAAWGSLTNDTKVTITDSAGYVGIGNTQPGAKLEIKDTNNTLLIVSASSVGATDIPDLVELYTYRGDFTSVGGSAISFRNRDSNNSANNQGRIKAVTANDSTIGLDNEGSTSFIFALSNAGTLADKVIFRGDGYVGIGTTNPSHMLTVYGDMSASNAYITNGGNDSVISVGTPGVRILENSANAFISAEGSVRINIDSNNNQTDRTFVISKDSVDSTAGTELFRVQENGNVGIGTTAPQASLHVYTTPFSGIRIGPSGSGVASDEAGLDIFRGGTGKPAYTLVGTAGQWYWTAGLDWQSWSNSHQYAFKSYNTSGAEQLVMILERDGNVGIGTTDPTEPLTVYSGSDGQMFSIKRGGSSTTAFYAKVSSNVPSLYSNNANLNLGINNPGGSGGETNYLTLNTNGNVGIGTTNPAYKLEVVGSVSASTHYGDGSNLTGIDTYWTASGGNISRESGVSVSGSFALWANQNSDFRFNAYNSNANSSAKTGFILWGHTAADGHNRPVIQFEYYKSGGGAGQWIGMPVGEVAFLATEGSSGQVFNARGAATSQIRFGVYDDLVFLITKNESAFYKNVGIGMSAPSAKLVVSQSAAADIINVFDGTTEVFTILDGGNVGIGKTNPPSKLTVQGDISSSGAITVGGDVYNTSGLYSLLNGSSAIPLRTSGILVGTTYDATPSSGRIQSTSNQDLTLDARGTGILYFQTNDSTKMSISASNVGIGTTTPNATFVVVDGADSLKAGNINSAGTMILQLQDSANTAYQIEAWQDDLRFNAGTSPTVTFTNAGYVGIGTTNPAEKVHISSSADDAIIRLDIGSFRGGFGAIYTPGTLATDAVANDVVVRSDNNLILTSGGSNSRIYVSSSGYVGIGTSAPKDKLEVWSSADDRGITIAAVDPNDAALSFRMTGDTYDNDILARIVGNLSNGTLTTARRGDIWFQHKKSGDALGTLNTAMVIDGVAGNVGIGTTGPSQLLHLSGSSPRLTISEATSSLTMGYWSSHNRIEAASGNNANLIITNYANKDILFETNGNNEKVRITSGGNVGIGTTSPASDVRLQVSSSNLNEVLKLTAGSGAELLIGEDPDISGKMRIRPTKGTGLAFTGNNDSIGLFISSSGAHVGIGATNPTALLQVGSGRRVEINQSDNGANYTWGGGGGWEVGYWFKGSSGTAKGGFGANGTNDTLNYTYIGTDYLTPAITFNHANRNVGIGTTSPYSGAGLQISGSYTNGIRINPGWINASEGTAGALQVGAKVNVAGTCLGIWQNETSAPGSIISCYNVAHGTTVFDVSAVGNVVISGSLTKGSGTFRIAHPDPSKTETTYLQHSFVESPTEGDNLYRFEVETINNECIIELPDYFKYLNKNAQIWISPKNSFGMAYGVISDDYNHVTIYSNQDGIYNVLIVGTRKDPTAVANWGGVEVDKPEKI